MNEEGTPLHELDRLDAALDGLLRGEVIDVPADLAPLLDAASAARQALSVEVPEHVAARHLEMISATGPAVVPMARARGRRRRVATIAVAAAVSVTVLASGAVAASSTALPGQALYPVKRATETISLALHGDPAEKARLHLEFAQRRLVELQELLAARRSGENVDIGAAMSAYQDQLARVEHDLVRSQGLGRDLDALLAHLEEQLGRHVATLTDLRDNRVPEQARDAIQRAIDNAEKAKARVAGGRQGSRGKPDGAGGAGQAPAQTPPGVSRGR